MKPDRRFAICLLLLAAAIGLPAFAFEYPLSSTTIREAYLLGTEQNQKSEDFFAQYVRSLPEIRVGPFPSVIRIETPFMQVAQRARQSQNYSIAEAEKDYLGRRTVFRLYLDIFYMPPGSGSENCDSKGGTPCPPGAPKELTFKLIQNRKQITPGYVRRSPLYPNDEYYVGQGIGERVLVEINPEKIDTSILRIEIRTPNGQQGEIEFDLAQLR